MKKTMNQGMLKQGNISFIKNTSHMMNNSFLFFDALKRAESSYEKVRCDGLQSLKPPQGFIFINPISAINMLNTIHENKSLLEEFASEVVKVSEGEYIVKDDCSRIEVPFKDKSYGNYSLALDIFGYTFGAKGSFKPIKNPLVLPQSTEIERLANLEFNIY